MIFWLVKMKKSSTSQMGWFCSYTPLEIIHASGCKPMRIHGHSDSIEIADS